MGMIKTIRLSFDGTTIDLTVEQAMALKDELNRLFTKEPQFVPYIPPIYPSPFVWYYQNYGDSTACLTWQSE